MKKYILGGLSVNMINQLSWSNFAKFVKFCLSSLPNHTGNIPANIVLVYLHLTFYALSNVRTDIF